MERLHAQRLNPRGSLIGRWELIMSVPQNPSAPVTHEAGIYMQLNADSTWERVENGVRTVGERFSNRYDSVKMAYEEHYYAFWAIRLYQSGRLIQKLPYYLTDTALVHSNSFTGLPGPSTWVWYLVAVGTLKLYGQGVIPLTTEEYATLPMALTPLSN